MNGEFDPANVPPVFVNKSEMARRVGRAYPTVVRWIESGPLVPDGMLRRPDGGIDPLWLECRAEELIAKFTTKSPIHSPVQ